MAIPMAKFELSKSVEGVKVNKRSGIPTTERVTVSFGAIIEDPREERDCLRFLHLGELIDVKYSEIHGYYKPIDGSVVEPAAKSGSGTLPASIPNASLAAVVVYEPGQQDYKLSATVMGVRVTLERDGSKTRDTSESK